MAEAKAAASSLRRRMIDDMSLRNLSPVTQRSYLHAVTKFSRHSADRQIGWAGGRPRLPGLFDVAGHFLSGAEPDGECAAFFYRVKLDRAELQKRIVYARTPRKLPAILSADEVVRILEAVPSLKAPTAYAAGLRASEAVSFKVADIDSERMLIQVRHGKGAKDRTVMLSPPDAGGGTVERGDFARTMNGDGA